MSDEMTYVADTLRQLADRMDTLEAWLPDGVTVTLTSGGVDSLVVELVDGDTHYGSIDPSVLVGVESSGGPLKEPNPTPDVTPLVERVKHHPANPDYEGHVTVFGSRSRTILIGLGDRKAMAITPKDFCVWHRRDALYHTQPALDAAAWAKDMRSVDLETERRVPEIGEWYKRGGCLFLRVSERSCFDPKHGNIIRDVTFAIPSGRDVITDDMKPYLFSEEAG